MDLEKLNGEFEKLLKQGENLRFYISDDNYCLDINALPEICAELCMDWAEKICVTVWSGVDDLDFCHDSAWTEGNDYPIYKSELHEFLGGIYFSPEGVAIGVDFNKQ